ncbi:hypothetical protein PG994_012032 [Apiospora phragmitis]|uniref:Uncharacterized protein n=1 Tax=Apiospora phragmitis TaxID=2905665 RepID=A0ABR1TUV6_9PEZI
MPSALRATKKQTNNTKQQQVCCPLVRPLQCLAASIITIKERIISILPSSIPRELASRFYNFLALAQAKKQGIWWHIGDRICRFGTRTQDVGLKAKNQAAAKASPRFRRHKRSNSRLLTWMRGGAVYEELDGERVRIE